LALGVFCGCAPLNFERLSWADVHFEENVVEVPSLASKTASRRFVPIRQTSCNGLSLIETGAGRFALLICASGLETDRKNAGLTEWRPMVCATHLGATTCKRFQNAGQTAMEMGHAKAEITFRHYNQRVRPIAAERFWRIAPIIEFGPDAGGPGLSRRPGRRLEQSPQKGPS